MLLYAKIGRGQENIDEALVIIKNGSEDPEDWICLIAAYRYSGDAESAYEWFAKTRSKFPDEAALYVYGGDACKSLKKYDEAFQCWKKALELDDGLYDVKYSIRGRRREQHSVTLNDISSQDLQLYYNRKAQKPGEHIKGELF